MSAMYMPSNNTIAQDITVIVTPRFSAAAITKQKVEEAEDTKPLYNCLDCVIPGAGQTLRSPLAAAPAKYIGCALGSNGPWHVCI